MARPRTPIGTFGEIEFTPLTAGGVRARVRFRDHDGQLRRVEAAGPTRKLAEHRLKENIAQRTDRTAGSDNLTPDSSFTKLVEVWLEDLDLEGRLAPSTRELYERDMRQLVLPAFVNFTLREISVRRVDQFIKRLAATKSYSKAKHARTVLSLAFGLAVRYDARRENPVRETARLRPPPSQAMALTVAQVEAIRHAVRAWRRDPGLCGPKPDGQLEQIIEVMLGTSAPKTAKSTRTVSVPTFTAEVLRERLVKVAEEDPEHLIFFSRNHTPLTTNNVRRRLRSILAEAGITGVTPHSFRRTVATVIDRAGGADLAAEMLGHTSAEITKQYYIQPDEKVNPVTAEILESLTPRKPEGTQ